MTYTKPSEQEIVTALGQLDNELNSAKSSLTGYEERVNKKASETSVSPTGIQIGTSPDKDRQAVQEGKKVIEPVAKQVDSALNIAPTLGTNRFLK